MKLWFWEGILALGRHVDKTQLGFVASAHTDERSKGLGFAVYQILLMT